LVGLTVRSLVLGLLLAALCTPAAHAQASRWIQQFGTAGTDWVEAATPDGQGGVYLTGATLGSLGNPNQGYFDAWLARFDGSGNSVWMQQLGNCAAEVAGGSYPDDVDWGSALAPDGAGGIYVAGLTGGSLAGVHAGDLDPWLARYDGGGGMQWIRQWGSSEADVVEAAAADGAGGAYVAGITQGELAGPNMGFADGWLSRWDSTGTALWSRQLGTFLNDFIQAATPDGAGGVYVAGYTEGTLGGSSAGWEDAWLARYDSAGTRLWLLQLGTDKDDRAMACSPDGAGGLYVGGSTFGKLGQNEPGNGDAWLARLDGSGNTSWIVQFGSIAMDDLLALAPDGAGGVWSCGSTWGPMGGPSAGSNDAWLAHHDGAGNLLSLVQLGTSGMDDGRALAPAGTSGMFVTGGTQGSLAGPYLGGYWDVWLARY